MDENVNETIMFLEGVVKTQAARIEVLELELDASRTEVVRLRALIARSADVVWQAHALVEMARGMATGAGRRTQS